MPSKSKKSKTKDSDEKFRRLSNEKTLTIELPVKLVTLNIVLRMARGKNPQQLSRLKRLSYALISRAVLKSGFITSVENLRILMDTSLSTLSTDSLISEYSRMIVRSKSPNGRSKRKKKSEQTNKKKP